MCEGLFGGVIDLDHTPGRKPELKRSSGEIVTIDLSGYSEGEIKEMGNLWGEDNFSTPQQGTTYMGIPFETESMLCLKR